MNKKKSFRTAVIAILALIPTAFLFFVVFVAEFIALLLAGTIWGLIINQRPKWMEVRLSVVFLKKHFQCWDYI